MSQITSYVTRRTTVLGLLLAQADAAAAQPRPCPPPRVLFVCPAGSVKSAIAREALKQAASRRGLAVDVQSRGVAPEDHVSPALAANLKAGARAIALDVVLLVGYAERGPVESADAAELCRVDVPGHAVIREVGERIAERR